MWRLKIIVAAGTALLFLAQAANAKIWLPGARKVAEPIASLLADLRKNKSNVFYTDCAIGDAIKAVLIFKAGETEGDFFILAYNPTGMVVAPSKGRVGIKRDGVYVLSVEGTSLQRLPQLAGSMTLGKFVFLGGDQDRASQIVTKRPEIMCSGEPNAKP
jgi:hypothetical protein